MHVLMKGGGGGGGGGGGIRRRLTGLVVKLQGPYGSDRLLLSKKEGLCSY